MEKYKKLGLKLTPQRLAVLEVLEGNTTHPSAEDIFREVKKRFPTVSFATVYNTLNALKEKGKLAELSIDPDRKRFDPDIRPHHHIVCIRCKSIVDILREYALETPEAERQGFEIIGNHVEFYGICPKCKERYHKVVNEEVFCTAEAEIELG